MRIFNVGYQGKSLSRGVAAVQKHLEVIDV
jgi:hypothetical protein